MNPEQTPMPRPLLLLGIVLALAGCGPVNRGLSTVHQPIVSRTATGSVATVPGCPDWSRASQPEFEASTGSNYGCATRSNLAAMIADPMDLVSPRIADGTDPYEAAKAIRSWRDTPSTGRAGLEIISTKDKR